MHTQLTLPVAHQDDLAVTLEPDQGNYGEVFTRRWVVDFILDLAGYTADRDLALLTAVEPSCGAGAFLGPMVERLIASCDQHGRPLHEAEDALRAFDLLGANVERARKLVVSELAAAGAALEPAQALAERWIAHSDFLLHDHREESADFVIGNPPYIRLENVPLEAKMMGTPKHANSPGEKESGRAGSADTNKRVKELAFKSIDLKGEAARRLTMVGQAPTQGGAGGGDLSTWLHASRPRIYFFMAVRVLGNTDFVLGNTDFAAVVRWAETAAQVVDAVGLYCYEPVRAEHTASGARRGTDRLRVGARPLPRVHRAPRLANVTATTHPGGRRPEPGRYRRFAE